SAILSNSKIEAVSKSLNDDGVSIILGVLQTALSDYQYTTKSGSQLVQPGELVRLADDYNGGGTAGGVYRYQGSAPATFDLGATDFTTSDWAKVEVSKTFDVLNQLVPNLTTPSKSSAVGGLAVRNDVRAATSATITDAYVTAMHGDLTVEALEATAI